eukprot:606869-Prorocentrum_lima.AAC.1
MQIAAVEDHLRKPRSPWRARAAGQPCCLVAVGRPSCESRAAHEDAHCLRRLGRGRVHAASRLART